jgi:hypothetical protein
MRNSWGTSWGGAVGAAQPAGAAWLDHTWARPGPTAPVVCNRPMPVPRPRYHPPGGLPPQAMGLEHQHQYSRRCPPVLCRTSHAGS